MLQRSSDTAYEFRQDSNFWYLTGINEPDVVLVMSGANEFLIVPELSESQQLFDGAIHTQELSDASGIATCLVGDDGWQRLKQLMHETRKAATIHPPASYIDQLGMYANPARQRLTTWLYDAQPGVELVDVRQELAALRCVKQAPEIAAITKAVNMTMDALADAEKQLQTAANERELAASVTAAFIRRDARHGYAPIIASGKNACTIHYIENNQPIDRSAFTLFDVGAELHNYSADITRVYHPERPSQRQTDVFAAVSSVQEYAMSLLRPGVLLRDYEQQVEAFMGEQLQKLKLIKKPDRESVRQFYPHSTSHFLGLDVHDVGDYTAPLTAGMVLTVEPGIYIPGESLAVRIEDDVLVTDHGIKVLGNKRP